MVPTYEVVRTIDPHHSSLSCLESSTYLHDSCLYQKQKTPRTAPLEQSSKMMMSSWFEIVELNAHTLPAALTITTSCLVYLKI